MTGLPKKVVITGASGFLGRKLSDSLGQRKDLDLVLLDRDPGGDPAVVAADFSLYDPDWVGRFRAAEVVIHLAANASPHADWDSLARDNVDAAVNVFEAAVKSGVARVLFASSARVMEGYADDDVLLTTALPPKPLTGYAVSKLLGERLGKACAERHGLSVICFRIGSIPTHGGMPTPDARRWDRQGWLSHGDFCRALELAIDAEDVDYAVLHLVSDCPGDRFDLSEAERVIGYKPQDSWRPNPPGFLAALRNSLARKKPGLCRWMRKE